MESKEKSVSISDLCAIIRQCGESGVKELSFESLKVSFKDKVEQTFGTQYMTPSQGVDEITPLNTVEEIIEDEEDYDEDNADLKEDEFATLHITDPFGYENMIGNPELMEQRVSELTKESDA